MIKLQLRDLEILNLALKQLDGYPVVVKQVSGQTVIFKEYKLVVAARLIIARNSRICRKVWNEHMDERNDVIRKLVGPDAAGIEEGDDKRMAQYDKAIAELMVEEHEVSLVPLPLAWLQLKDNPQLPMSVVAGLGPIIPEKDWDSIVEIIAEAATDAAKEEDSSKKE